MKTKNQKRGLAVVPILVVVGLLGIGAWLFKPKALDGESKRAAASSEATAALEAATKKQGAEAAASVVKIVEVNAMQPASPKTDFVAKEGQVALSKLPAPDAQALFEAEQRKVAILTGQVQQAGILYKDALQHSAELQTERDAALAQRQAVDDKLKEAAAENLGRSRERNMAILSAIGLALLTAYVKFTHLSPGGLADLVKGITVDGMSVEHAVDWKTNTFTQGIVNRALKLKQDFVHKK